LKLPGETDALVRSVLKAVPNAIIVNQSGMPVELPWVKEAPTLLQAFFGGNECGTAIAQAIFGQINPSGKLPITWPVKVEDFASNKDFGDAITTVYSEGLNVGYRWFDAPGRPRSEFPFGFGGSYTTFEFRLVYLKRRIRCLLSLAETSSDLSVQASSSKCGAQATFKITNNGERSGACVAQVYVHEARPSVEKPDVELGGFAKVNLQPGESQEVMVKLDVRDIGLHDLGLPG
jgi:beta-glucosidase